jgi:hypothetical protein
MTDSIQNTPKMAAFATMVPDLSLLTPQQRQNLARWLDAPERSLESIHETARRLNVPPGSAPPGPAGPVKVSDGQFAQMSSAQRLDHARQFNQSTMPPWRDPRGG